MTKVLVEIEASNWTQDNVDAFEAWLTRELYMSNMSTGCDATVVSAKIVEA